jgi:hypothetical protein
MDQQDEKLLEYCEIAAIIKGAFKPLRCGLKDDYRHTFKFRLYDREKCVYRVEENVLTESVSERSKLKPFLEKHRAEVQKLENVNLDPWDFPGSI